MPMTVQIWVCKSVKVPGELQGRLQKLQNRALGPAAEDLAKIGGFPIQSVITINMGGQPATSTTTVKKISYGPIPGSMFEVPAGYKRMAPPQMQRPPAGR